MPYVSPCTLQAISATSLHDINLTALQLSNPVSDKHKLNITFVKRRPQRDPKNHISAVVAVAAHCNNDVYYHSGLQCHNRCSALLRTMRNSPTCRRRDSILMRCVQLTGREENIDII